MLKFFRWRLRHPASSLVVSAAPTSLPLLSHSRSVLHLSFYLNSSRRSGRNCFLSPHVLSGYNGFPDTRFSRGTTRLMSWPDGERYSCTQQSLVVSLVLSLVSTFLTLAAYCLIKVLWHTGSLDFHRGTCAATSRLLCSLSSLLQRTQPTVKLPSL